MPNKSGGKIPKKRPSKTKSGGKTPKKRGSKK